jgi:hypothetical protein
MRMFKLTLLALAGLFAFSTAAEAIEVKKRREAPGVPAAVWEVVGGFCAIKNWHPAVAECEEITEGDDVFRILTLKDGGKIKERLTGKGDTSYSYEIIESPLPVKNYKAKLEVGEDDEENRIEIVWKAEFDANGVSDDEAKKVIVGIFEDGVKGIKQAALALSDSKEDDDD